MASSSPSRFPCSSSAPQGTFARSAAPTSSGTVSSSAMPGAPGPPRSAAPTCLGPRRAGYSDEAQDSFTQCDAHEPVDHFIQIHDADLDRLGSAALRVRKPPGPREASP
eukprot:15144794-Alexandrium_andersonii.AAC.1